MPKGLLVFVVVLGIALAVSQLIKMKQSADTARASSDKIMEEFETVDKDLKASSLETDTAKKRLFDSLVSKMK
jgi:hypothetical protein